MAKRTPPRDERRPLLEELEPRILLSADLDPLLLDPDQVQADPALEDSLELEARSETGQEAAEPAAQPDQPYLSLPLGFEENRGQSVAEVDFFARGSGYSVFLSEGDAVLALQDGEAGYSIRLDLLGADADAAVAGDGLLSASSNYLIGDEPDAWETGVSQYGSVTYEGVYDGIDIRYYGNQRQLEYDFIVDAGADAGQIRLDFLGAESVHVDANGDLVVVLSSGRGDEVRFQAPISHQVASDGGREAVESAYAIHADGSVGFALGDYDAGRELVIDPILDYGTYLGGTGLESARAVAIDDAGSAYVTGRTGSTDFPTTVGAYGSDAWGYDIFVSKLSADGSTLLWSTYVGGDGADYGYAIAVDASGSVYVGGQTESSDIPSIAPAAGARDGLVFKLNPTGTALDYATYLGGAGSDTVNGLAVDASGNLFVTGDTNSAGLATLGAYDTTVSGGDAFVARLDSGGSVVWASYLGGSGSDLGLDLALDGAGNPVITGRTDSTDLTTSAGAFAASNAGGNDAYVATLAADGTSLLYASYFGGSNTDDAQGVAVDASGRIFITGRSNAASTMMPTTAGAYDTTHNSGADVFFAVLDPSKSGSAQLAYSTFLGGSSAEQGYGIAIDSDGRAWITGYAVSPTFPTTADADDATIGGSRDAFVAAIDPAGGGTSDLVYSTYLGGDGNEWGYGIAVNAFGDVVAVGETESTNFATTTGAHDSELGGSRDAYVAKLTAPSSASAIWAESGSSIPETSAWNGSGFGPEGTTATTGEWRIMQGAEAPTRDEKIVAGITSDGKVSGMIWNGSTWSAIPGGSFGTVSETYWWGVDVAYESVSGDAVLVWNDSSQPAGDELRFRVWNGSSWTAAASIAAYTGSEPQQLKLAADPNSDEMVLVVSDSSADDHVLVWSGSGWGNALMVDASGTGENDQSGISVAYESQSGDAMVAYGHDGDPDLYYRIWNGTTWEPEASLAAPTGVTAQATWTSLASDPGSDRLAVSVLTSGGTGADVWLAVWTGGSWQTPVLAETTATGSVFPDAAVAFESQSGEAIAVYGENGQSAVRYRTWSETGGWSAEQTDGPALGATPNSMTLDSDPLSDRIMLSVQDSGSDLNYVLWSGGAWGTPTQLEADSGETKNQPFLFLWNATEQGNAITGTIHEDLDGDASLADAVGAEGVDVLLYRDDGDGTIDAGDSYVSTVQTDASGAYRFSDLRDGTYWVVVDSKTLAPDTGLNAGFLPGDVWAEQTWGSDGAVSFDGAYNYLGAAGAFYGGMQGEASDDASALTSSEHVTRVSVSGADATGVDSAFSFNVVTRTGDGDDDLAENRSVQGSLRQFIQNSNAIAGVNTSQFAIATADSGYAAGTGVYTIQPGAGGLPDLTDAVILDATTQAGFGGAPIIELDGALATGATAGINIRANDSTVRGFIVHSFEDEGIEIDASTGFGQDNVVQNNWVGVDETGTAHANTDYGVMITVGSAGNLIDGNVISGNANSGIMVRNAGSDDNVITGNLIGLAPDGSTPVANAGHGIEIIDAATGNRIGGADAGDKNVIAHNLGDGIRLGPAAGTDNAFLGNEIYSNTGLGIDLGGDGVTVNDLDGTDDDGGPNRQQNFPVLTLVNTDQDGTVKIAGTLVGLATTDYRVEYFTSGTPDGSGYGEAERLLGFVDVTTDASGNASIDTVLAAKVLAGEAVTATATVDLGSGAHGDTSEFAANVVANGGPNAVPDAALVDEGSSVTIDLAANDTDPEGNLDLTSIAITSAPAFGTLVDHGNGTVTYTHNGSETTGDSFSYTIDDVTGQTSNVAAVTITVNPVNDAPTLASSTFLGSIREDTFTDSGTAIASIVSSPGFSDPDVGALKGIAIVGADTTNGDWQFTLDGTTWQSMGTPSLSSATLLAGDGAARVRFVPDANWNGTAALQYKAWDQTTGVSGGTGDATTSGGTTAFSTNTSGTSKVVSAVNDAPVRTSGTVQDLIVAEDSGLTSLALVGLGYGPGGGADEVGQTLTYEVFVIPDPVALGKIYLANGTTEVSTGFYTLTEMQGMQFAPAANASGGPSFFSFRIQDSGGTANGGVDTVAESIRITVTRANDAPVLTGANNLAAIDEDPVGNPGTLVSDLLAGHVTDGDAGASAGIAVVGLDDSNGTWEFTTDGGGAWIAFGTPSDSAARLLAADASTSVRFAPDADWNGTVTGGITFRAWDQTGGSAGDVVDLAATYTLLDRFDTASFGNDDGTASWTGGWIEADASGAGPGAGNIVVVGGELSIRGVGNTIARQADLSGAVSATLSFDFRTTAGVEAGDPDSVVLEISPDGGSTWIGLETFDSFDGVNSGSRSYDIEAYTESDTQVRFRVENGYGEPDEYFIVDDVQVQYTMGVGGSTPFSAATASSSITVNPVNDDPTATADSYSTAEDTPLTIAAAGVLANDGDVDGDTLSAILDAGPANGTLVLNANGSFTYTPDADFHGSDSFTYHAEDPSGASSETVTVDIDVTPVNDDPTATADSYSTAEDTPLTIAAAGVLANDGDVDEDTLSAVLDAGPANGTLVLNANGSFTYTPDADFHGADSFTYHAEDPSGASSETVTVDIDVTPVNDDPTATADSYSTAEDTPLTIAAAGVLANDGDVDGDTLSAILDAGPANGTLVLNANGSFTYTPDADFHGSDSFTYHAEDPSGASSETVTVDIDVTPVNDDPTATADSYSTAEDTPLTVAAAGVLANDGDVDGDTLSAILDAGPSNGTLALNANGSFTYTPDADFNGADSFTYHAEDPSGASSGVVTVDIDVTSVNDDPTATADSYSTAEDTPLTIAAAGVLTNDGDVDGDTLSAVLDSGPANGTLGLNADGSFTYTPDADFHGADSFTYHAEDPSGATSETVTVDIDVTPVNDDPTATADTYSTAEDTPLTVAAAGVLANDGDVDGDTLSAVLDAGPSNGTLSLNADGSFTYTPDADFHGADSFTYHAEDPSGATSETVTVDIDVTPVNDDPTATADSYSTAEDTPLTIAAAGVLANDGDVDGDTLSAVLDSGPANGTLGLNADGSFTYTPDADFHGADSFTYHAEDPSGATSETVTVDIDVTPVNDDPTATADTYSTAEDTPLTIAAAGVLTNDGDVDGDTTSAILDSGPANGTLVLNANGSFTYTPDADFHGTDSFTYHAEDPSGASSGIVTVDIDVTPVNDDPTATADSYSTAEDTPLTIAAAGVLANDGDVDGDTLSAILDSGPANGTLVLNANGSFTYTPDADFHGSDSFTYHAEDPSGASSGIVTVDIDVTPVNDDPTATADSYSTAEDTPLTVAAAGVLTNDGDVDGDTLSAVLDSGPANGTLVLNADGSFTYTPDADFHGADSFTYHAEDPSGASSEIVTVDIEVTPVNDDPTATADSYSTAEDTPLTIAAAGVLTNDGDVDGDTLSAVLDSGPANGTLVLNANGSFTYTPDADFHGTDSFTYHAEDPSGASSGIVTVDIDVTPVNDDPTATADTYSTAEDTPLTIAAAGVLTNDGDVDGDTLSAVLDSGPANGTLGLNADGSFTYTPDADFHGTNSFTYHAEDPSGASSGIVTVDIDVTPVNDDPTAAADSYSTAEDTPLTIAAAGVLANDGDVDGDTLSAVLDAGPSNGTLSLNADGSFTYTPDADFTGSDSFTYHAEDPSGASSSAVMVSIDVGSTNDAPTATGDSYSTAEDAPLTIAAAGVLTNDGDVDGDTLSAILDAGPSNGTLVLNANGSFTYTPDADFHGADSFTYHAEDPSGASSETVTVDIDVTPVNDDPTAAADSYSTAEDTPLTIAAAGVLANDGDVDGDTLSAVLDAGPSNGTLSLNADGSFTYTPDADFTGSDSFTYHAEDPSGASSSAVMVSIDVGSTNDAPTATGDSYSTAEDAPLTIAAAGVLTNDGDVDGDTLSAILDAGPSNGTLVLNANGSFTYTPDADFHGADSFTYHAEDPSGASSETVTVDIDVTPVNDDPTAAADSYSTAEDTPLTIAAAGVLANDGDVDGDTLSAILDAGPSNGTLVLNANGSFTYTPDADFHGADSFTYHAEDPSGASSETVTVDIDVTPVNDDPTAAADSYSTAEDTPLTIAAAGALANDGDVDGDTLSAILDAGPSNGTLVLNANGSFTYTPDADFHGADSFTYHAEDPSGASSETVTVDIDVTPVNDDPTAAADSYSTAEDTPLTIAAAGVLANDGDVDGDTLSAVLDAGPSNGTLVLNANGSFTYTPDADFHGADSFTYHAEDPSGASSETVTVDIDVTPVNDDPTAAADSYSTAEDTPLTIAAAGVLANDGDVDGDTLSAVLDAGPTNGTLVLNANGSFTYTPDADFHGTDSFTYHAEDPSGASSGIVTVDIDVTPVNDDPTATADTYSTAEDTPLTIAAAGVLANDGDVDGDTLSTGLVGGPSNGALILNADGSFTYAPDADFSGTDSFTYQATDPSAAASGPVTVSVDVSAVNDAPQLGSNSLSIGQGETVLLTTGDMSAADIDNSTSALLFTVSNVQAGRFELVTSPGAALGSFTQGQVASGQVQFAHDGSALAPSYDVVVDDGGLTDAGTASVSFTPSPPADPAPVDEPPPGDPDPDPPTEPSYSDIDQAVGDPEPPAELPEPETVPESGEPEPTESSAPAGATAPEATPGGAPEAGSSLRLDPESRLRAAERRAAGDLEGLPTVDITLMAEEVDRDKDTQDDQAAANAARMARAGASPLFWDALDQMRREIAEDSERHARTQDLLMSAAEGLALMTSTGLLAALLRSESLLALALSYIPAWRRVDPMAVLTLSPEERKKREREMRSAREAEDRKLHELGEILDGNEAQEQADPEHAPGEDDESSQGEPEPSSENRED